MLHTTQKQIRNDINNGYYIDINKYPQVLDRVPVLYMLEVSFGKYGVNGAVFYYTEADGYTHRYAIVGRTSNLFKAIGKAIRV